jgi:hypothetical protein
MGRPALQRLMADIQQGSIFVKMVEAFDARSHSRQCDLRGSPSATTATRSFRFSFHPDSFFDGTMPANRTVYHA